MHHCTCVQNHPPATLSGCYLRFLTLPLYPNHQIHKFRQPSAFPLGSSISLALISCVGVVCVFSWSWHSTWARTQKFFTLSLSLKKCQDKKIREMATVTLLYRKIFSWIRVSSCWRGLFSVAKTVMSMTLRKYSTSSIIWILDYMDPQLSEHSLGLIAHAQ